MNGRFNDKLQANKFSAAKRPNFVNRVPFWVSGSNYYVLTFGIALTIFFVVFFFTEETGEVSIVYAGVSGAGILIFASLLRAILIRRRQRQMFFQNKIRQKSNTNPQMRRQTSPEKLTIEKNALLLEEIEKKSKAAVVLANLPQAHLEVFEFCDEYLRKNLRELESVGVGSPRIAVLKKSRKTVEKYHKYHLLSWASLESRLLIKDAQELIDSEAKLEFSSKALTILDSASEFYPNEKILTDSSKAVKDFIFDLKLNNLIEAAEKSAAKADYKQAEVLYKEVLFFLARDNERTTEKDLTAEKINSEIAKLKRFAPEK